jgi:hypothetical protein
MILQKGYTYVVYSSQTNKIIELYVRDTNLFELYDGENFDIYQERISLNFTNKKGYAIIGKWKGE